MSPESAPHYTGASLAGRLYLLGKDISHSLSPHFHNKLFTTLGLSWKFQLLDTPDPEDLIPLMREPNFVGASVTMPYKVAIMKHIDHFTDAAKLTQAVNHIYVEQDSLTNRKMIVGTNTDCVGISNALLAAQPEVIQTAHGRPGMVIGGGGACRAAVYALRKMLGCNEIYLVNRNLKELEQLLCSFEVAGFDARCVCVRSLDQAMALEAPAVIIGTIPDITPQSEGEIMARAITAAFLEKSCKGVLLDMCYHPSPETQLISLSRQHGWTVVSGVEMFLFQAIEACSIWTHMAVDQLPIAEVWSSILSLVK